MVVVVSQTVDNCIPIKTLVPLTLTMPESGVKMAGPSKKKLGGLTLKWYLPSGKEKTMTVRFRLELPYDVAFSKGIGVSAGWTSVLFPTVTDHGMTQSSGEHAPSCWKTTQ